MNKPATFSRPVVHRRIGDDGRYDAPFTALAADYSRVASEPNFFERLDRELGALAQRPSPLHDAQRLTRAGGGARILLKREDLCPPGSRLLTAVAGEAVVARALKKSTLVTSTVSGPRGVAAAAVAARLGLKAVIFMDRDDLDRHKDAVFRMKLLGADIRAVTRRDLPERDVRIPALDHWAQAATDAFPVMGLDAAPGAGGPIGPDILAVFGRETQRQVQALTGGPAHLLVARGGETTDAIGWFEPFLPAKTRLACVEPSHDLGIRRKDEPLGGGRGPSADALKRISQADVAAREHAPVGREHGLLRASGRVEYATAAPGAAHKALTDAAALEGAIPSMETAHAIAWACSEAAHMKRDQTVVVMIAENVDADLAELSRQLEGQL